MGSTKSRRDNCGSPKAPRIRSALLRLVCHGFAACLLLTPSDWRSAQGQSALAGRTPFAGAERVPEEAKSDRCLRMVSPRYPAGITAGTQELVVRVLIDKNGEVHPLYMVSGRHEFENEAMNALWMWRYRPFTRNDQPIAMAMDVRVRFVPGIPAGSVTHPSH